jgi:predicted  nucleic acid-binding Zn-ribbon protein
MAKLDFWKKHPPFKRAGQEKEEVDMKFAEVKKLIEAQGVEITALRGRVDSLVRLFQDAQAAHEAELAELGSGVADNTDVLDDILVATGGESGGGVKE